MKNLLSGLFLCIALSAYAQTDTLLKSYFVQSKLTEDCYAQVAVTLFDEAADMDPVNENILNELMKGYYDRSTWVTVKNLYAKKSFPPSADYIYTIASECSFHKNDIFSFTACTYNVCDKNIYSNYESNCVTFDMKTQQQLSLYDIIDPAKKDSFEKYVYYTATRYHIKNIPTCYFSGYNPVQIRGSSSTTIQTDSITYMKGLTNKFYLKDNFLFVYNKVKHRSYNYNSVEVMFMFNYLRYFFRPEMITRLELY